MVSKKNDLKKEAEATVALNESKPEPASAAPVEGQAPEPVPRPSSPFTKALGELREAFPDGDEAVRRAVLVAAGGRLERAFNGMLALTDDTIRPNAAPAKEAQSQIARDEELARQLERDYRARSSHRNGDESTRATFERGPRQFGDLEHDNDSWDAFQENLRQGWTETTKKVSSLFGQLRERIQNEMGDSYEDGEHDLYGVPDNRRSSQGRREHRPAEDEEAPPPPPRPGRSASKPVNAFGEEQASRWQPLQASETSDAFFIGESDSDLESLTEPVKGKSEAVKTDKAIKTEAVKTEAAKVEADKAEKAAKTPKADKAPKADKTEELSVEAPEPETAEAELETEADKPASKAKDLLKQVKEKNS